jgi:hypothetical protein
VIKRDALVSVSLANLLFLESWGQVQATLVRSFYNREFVTRGDLLCALIPSILLASAAIFVTLRAVRRAGSPWVYRASEAIILLLLYIPLRQAVLWVAPLGWRWRIIHAFGLVLLVGAAAIASSRRQSPIRVDILVMGFWPLLPFLFIQFCLQPHPSRAAAHDQATAPIKSSALRQRVVLVIFDEWDRYLTFEARPNSIQLPEIDRFREGAIDVERVDSPTIWTRSSLPSLLTGHLVESVEPKGPDKLLLTLESGRKEIFGQGTNLFRSVRELGGNTALAGWYLPYCRVLAQDLCDCTWEPYDQPIPAFAEDPPYLPSIVLAQWRSLFLAVPLVHRLYQDSEHDERLWRQAIVRRLLSRGLYLAGEARFNLVVLHLPMPHEPGIFDRHTMQFSTSPSANYLDNLVLVDHFLGELRVVMQRQGTWDSTLLLLTSDHPYRAHVFLPAGELSRVTGNRLHPFVPFLLKMPGQEEGQSCKGPLKTLVVQDLILSFLRGEVRETTDMVTWLRKHEQGVWKLAI